MQREFLEILEILEIHVVLYFFPLLLSRELPCILSIG